MKKLVKGSGLYNFLNNSGVLANGTSAEIQQQKVLYWKQYRKQWKRNKRQQSKTIVLFYTFKQAKLLSTKAESHSLSIPAFIKQVSLSNEHFATPVLLGKVREIVMQFTNSVNEVTRNLGSEMKTVLENAIQMETEILNILQPKFKSHHH